MAAAKHSGIFSPSTNWNFWISDFGFDMRSLVRCKIFITNGILSLSLPVFHKIKTNLQKRTFPLWFSRFVSYSGRANWQIKSNHLIYNFVNFYFRFSQKMDNNVKIIAGIKNCRCSYLCYLAIVDL